LGVAHPLPVPPGAGALTLCGRVGAARLLLLPKKALRCIACDPRKAMLLGRKKCIEVRASRRLAGRGGGAV
jgi:hypothetical protein